jgi:hypothetical protein
MIAGRGFQQDDDAGNKNCDRNDGFSEIGKILKVEAGDEFISDAFNIKS